VTLTPAQLRILRAYALTGYIQGAADACGVTLQTAKNEVSAAYFRLGVGCAGEAWRALGWLRLPDEAAVDGLSIAEELLASARTLEDAARRLRAIADPGSVSPEASASVVRGDDPARDREAA